MYPCRLQGPEKSCRRSWFQKLDNGTLTPCLLLTPIITDQSKGQILVTLTHSKKKKNQGEFHLSNGTQE
jgi:hypothetical protein